MNKKIDRQSLQTFNIEELKVLAEDVRQKIIETNVKTPLHLSSNLGMVEISLGVLNVFSLNDKVLFDTGHQSYTHKLITHGWDCLDNIRGDNGISGFADDVFVSGHSGNALSAGAGFAEDNENTTIVVVGDAGITNGQTLEALNNIMYTKKHIVVIINDNGMSISKSVGCLAQLFEKSNSEQLKQLTKGTSTVLNGNEMSQVISSLRKAKEAVKNGPVVIHFKTKKGLGLTEALADTSGKYHMSYNDNKVSFGKIAAAKIATKIPGNNAIRVINPAMTFGTGFVEFAEKFPNNYRDVGMSEEHALTYGVGLKLNKYTPILIYYSTFLQRAYDQILIDAYCNKVGMLVLVDRADISPGDGETHHGIHDVAFLKNIPNVVVASPRNPDQLEQLIDMGINSDAIFCVRYPRAPFSPHSKTTPPLKLGKWELLSDKKAERCILTFGPFADVIAEELKNDTIDIVCASFIVGYEPNVLESLLSKYKEIIVYERVFNGSLVHDLYKAKSQTNSSTLIHEMNYKIIPRHGSLDVLDAQANMSINDIKRLLNR